MPSASTPSVVAFGARNRTAPSPPHPPSSVHDTPRGSADIRRVLDTREGVAAGTQKGADAMASTPRATSADQRRLSTTAFSVAEGRMTFSTSSAFGR